MFLVAGEALMDVFTGESTDNGISLDARIGGSPLNVAVGLARLAQPVSFLGCISTGRLGERLVAALQDEGVGVTTVHRSPAPTTLGLVGVRPDGVPDYAFYGDGAADRCLPLAALDRVPAATRALHVGSYSMVAGETATTQAALVEQVRGRLLVSYDLNLRLNVEPELGVWRTTLDWMAHRADILKLSDEDLHALYPGLELDAFAQACLAKGVGLVIVTQGSRGVTAWRRDRSVEVAALPVDVADTVGAGDSFQAALLARLAEIDALTPEAMRKVDADSLRDILEFASYAAALTCSRKGADLPRREELLRDRQ